MSSNKTGQGSKSGLGLTILEPRASVFDAKLLSFYLDSLRKAGIL